MTWTSIHLLNWKKMKVYMLLIPLNIFTYLNSFTKKPKWRLLPHYKPYMNLTSLIHFPRTGQYMDIAKIWCSCGPWQASLLYCRQCNVLLMLLAVLLFLPFLPRGPILFSATCWKLKVYMLIHRNFLIYLDFLTRKPDWRLPTCNKPCMNLASLINLGLPFCRSCHVD